MSDAATPAQSTQAAAVPTKIFSTGKPAPNSPRPQASKATRAVEQAAALAAPAADEPAHPAVETKTEPTPPAEPPKTEQPKPEKPTAALQAQFSALAKAEKRTREERDALAREKEAFSQEMSETRQIKEIAARDKYALLDHLGVDLNEWARRKLGKAAPEAQKPAEDPIRAEIEALKKEREQERAEAAARAAQQTYETARVTSLAEIAQLVDSDAAKYEFIRARKATPVVFSVIETHFGETGKLLSYAEACDLVEQHLEEDAQSYAGVEKFRRKLAPQGESRPDTKPTPSGTRANPQPQALTNQLSTTPERVDATKGLTALERKRQRRINALAALAERNKQR